MKIVNALVLLAACTTTDRSRLVEVTPKVYTLPDGEAVECNASFTDDCGWHLKSCGYEHDTNFDCLEHVWVQGDPPSDD